MEQLHTNNSGQPLSDNTSFPPETEIDIKSILGRMLRHWYLFIIFPLLTVFTAWLYIRYSITEYQVKSVILVKESAEDKAMADMVGNMGGFNNQKDTELANQMQILGSFSILYEVVDSLDLHIHYIQEGRIKDAELYGIKERPFLLTNYVSTQKGLFQKALSIVLNDNNGYTLQEGESFHAEGILGEPLYMPFGQITIEKNPQYAYARKDAIVKITDPILAARIYSTKLQIKTIGNSELLEMSLVDHVPQRAIDIINAVISAYNRSTVEEKNLTSVKTMDFVNDRLDYLTNELNEVEIAGENYVIQQEIIGGADRKLTAFFEQIRANELTVIQLDVKLDALNQVEKVLNQQSSDSLSYLPYSLTLDNLNLTPLLEQFNKLQQERERLLAAAQPDNPILRPVEEQITEVNRIIRTTLKEARQKINNEQIELRQKNKKHWASIQQIPGQERGLLAIERQQNIREQLYLFLLQKREETALAQASAVSDLRILEEPMLRGVTSAPPLYIYAGAFLLGLILPIGLLTLQEVLDDTINSAQQLKQLTAIPFLGALAQNSSGEHIVVSKSSRTAIAEMFRMMRTNLQFIGVGKTQQTMLVTSSMGGEGKTFVCINLGISLAISGKRVLLIGMDLRKPKLKQYIASENFAGIGLTNYLTGQAALQEVIHPSEINNQLDFIPSGPIPPNPAELLMLPEMNTLFAQLRELYDYILIDMPPVGLVADALLLGKYVDSALYVTRFGKTKKGQLVIADEIYQSGKLPNLALVLNGVKTGAGYGYGYDYGYGYGYGYGYYEGEN